MLLYSNEPRLGQQVQQLDPDLLATCTKYYRFYVRIHGLSRNFHGFPGPMPFPELTKPGILNNKIPALSRVCTNTVLLERVGLKATGIS